MASITLPGIKTVLIKAKIKATAPEVPCDKPTWERISKRMKVNKRRRATRTKTTISGSVNPTEFLKSSRSSKTVALAKERSNRKVSKYTILFCISSVKLWGI
jgi:hypothetical protein